MRLYLPEQDSGSSLRTIIWWGRGAEGIVPCRSKTVLSILVSVLVVAYSLTLSISYSYWECIEHQQPALYCVQHGPFPDHQLSGQQAKCEGRYRPRARSSPAVLSGRVLLQRAGLWPPDSKAPTKKVKCSLSVGEMQESNLLLKVKCASKMGSISIT